MNGADFHTLRGSRGIWEVPYTPAVEFAVPSDVRPCMVEGGYGADTRRAGRSGGEEEKRAGSASDDDRSTSALALELGVQPLRRSCHQVLEQLRPAVQVR